MGNVPIGSKTFQRNPKLEIELCKKCWRIPRIPFASPYTLENNQSPKLPLWIKFYFRLFTLTLSDSKLLFCDFYYVSQTCHYVIVSKRYQLHRVKQYSYRTTGIKHTILSPHKLVPDTVIKSSLPSISVHLYWGIYLHAIKSFR